MYMDKILFMFTLTLVYAVTSAMVEFPSRCTTEDFVILRKLQYSKMDKVKFTVNNANKNASDALKGSKKAYKTSTDDTFTIILECYVPLELQFIVINVKRVKITVTLDEGGRFTEEIHLNDPSIKTTIGWSHPAKPVRILEISLSVVEGMEAQVRGLTMKYCVNKSNA